ncbi:uncharacterized protein N7506_003977 [Penicillium brevicompactum]|uniref:uncharacterized protein n=1 Tax=Penicillium brevicompactum TaxID=5074 RepID=UPI0025413A8E|nr:uncharacterized protein N7506_003977 [Penicillium brevicompactum]KAJ5335955.1 hypothetical protein N7506_003977 [Penicillium brevicompactum]
MGHCLSGARRFTAFFSPLRYPSKTSPSDTPRVIYLAISRHGVSFTPRLRGGLVPSNRLNSGPSSPAAFRP